MKKKLFLAMAVIGAMSCQSCQEDPASSTQESAKEYYTRAFIHEFGLIDPNHTWGFTFDAPGSRAIFTNGNEWRKTWWAPQDVTQEEHDWVMAYVGQDASLITTVELNQNDFHNFFVTHVGSSMEEYSEVGGSSNFAGGTRMDYLHIAQTQAMKEAGPNSSANEGQSEWPHINNFNAAGNSSWSGHMLVVADNETDGAYDFCYHNSYSGGFYTRYKIVPGSAITAANGALDQYYYLCFDYMVKDVSENSETGFYVTFEEGSYVEGEFVSNGSDPRTEEKMFAGVYLNSDKTAWPSESDFYTAIGKTTDNARITSISIHRYNNAKVVEPNNIYDDWVIRLVGNATPKTETPPSYVQDTDRTKRVFVEDLAGLASYDLDVKASDWDFNDVVFDVSVDEATRKATIKLLALGGTLPAYIGTDENNLTAELHSLMGYDSDVMINTGMGATHDPVMVDTGDMQFDPYDYRSVKIFVKVNGNLVEMTAETGQAPAKVAARTTDTWATERQHIDTHWTSFRSWVSNSTYNNWTQGLGGNQGQGGN